MLDKILKNKHVRIVLIVLLFLYLLGSVVTAVANIVVYRHGSDIVHTVEELERRPVALVFGGGMKEDGSMSAMQTDRVIRAIELYKAGKVEKLIMTGDDGTNRRDEVHAMEKFAIEGGVPAEDIETDGKSFNTYLSCKRAKEVLDIDKAVAISQRFHLPRILFFCNKLGVDTVGLSSDLRPPSYRGRVWTSGIREMLARVKGLWSVYSN